MNHMTDVPMDATRTKPHAQHVRDRATAYLRAHCPDADQLIHICDALGVNPANVSEIVITPETVTITTVKPIWRGDT